MTNKPQEIDITVEADASAATRSAAAVAKEITALVGSVGKLEDKFRSLFSGQMPAEMEKMKGYINSLNQAMRISKTLATGGPLTQMTGAAYQGELAKLRTDKSLQLLKYEKEVNKVLEARGILYERMRKLLPDEASEKSRSKMYRDSLGMIDDTSGDTQTSKKSYMDRTLREVRAFEKNRSAILQSGLMDRAQSQARFDNRQFDLQAKAAERSLKAAQLLSERRKTQDDRAAALYERGDASTLNRARTVDDRAKAAYEQTQAERNNARQNALDRRRATTIEAASPEARAQRASVGLQNTHDRFSANGGAGMLGVQAAVLRNYAVVGGVLGTVGYAAKSTIEFQTSLKDVQAIAKATDTEMKQLRGSILDVGNSTKFSVKEISEGVKVLAQAGYGVQQIQEVIKPIADLAAGSGSSFADSANVVTSVLSVFDLSISRASDVTNTLVAGLNQSKLSMDQLSLGIQYAGNIAADGGVQFEELVAALGAMANAGIKSGSTLGTGIRSLIADFENPSKKLVGWLEKVGLTVDDVSTRTHTLGQVLETLNTHSYDSATAMDTLELRASAAYSALSNNQDFYNQSLINIQGTQAATEAAGTQMETFSAQWTRLTNNVTAFATMAGAPLLGVLQGTTSGLADVLAVLQVVAPAAGFVTTALGSLAIVAGAKWGMGLIAGLMTTTGLLPVLAAEEIAAAIATGSLSLAMGILSKSLLATSVAMLASPVGWLALGLTAIITVVSLYKSEQEKLTEAVDKYATATNKAAAEGAEYANRANEIDKYIQQLIAHHQDLSEVSVSTVEAAKNKFGEWGLVIDGTTTRVSQLIDRMISLRSQMAQASLDQAIVQQGTLQQENSALGKKIASGSSRVVQGLLTPQAFMHKRELQGAGIWQAVQGSLKGREIGRDNPNPLSANELQTLFSTLALARTKLKDGGARDSVDRMIAKLQPLRVDLSNQRQNDTRINALTSVIGTRAVERSNGSASNTRLGISEFSAYQAERNAIMKGAAANPKVALAQLGSLQTKWAGKLPGIRAEISAMSDKLAQDPTIAAGYAERARSNSTSVSQEITKDQMARNPQLVALDMLDKGPLSANSGASATTLSKRYRAEANLAKKSKNPREYRRLMGLAQQADDRGKLLKAQSTGDFEGMGESIANNDVANKANTEAGLLGGRKGPKTDASGRRKAAADVKALERLIEVSSAQSGPNASDIEANQGKLKELLSKWSAARVAEIKASGSSADEITSRLRDFQETEAPKYIAEILNGNIQAAKDLLAKKAEEAAGSSAADSARSVYAGGKSVDKALSDVRIAFADAAAKAVDASNEEFKAKYGTSFDPSIAHDSTVNMRKIQRDFVTKALAAMMTVLDAEASRQAEDIAKQQDGLDRRQVQISALSNAYGSRNLSDVQRSLGSMAGEGLAIDNQKLDVANLTNQAGIAKQRVDAIRPKAAADPGNSQLATDLLAAEQASQAMDRSLAQAKNNLDAMTMRIEPFATASQAIAASWTVYADQVGLAKPVFEQLADGMSGVFETSRTSFASLVTDVLTGAKTMGSALKDFTISVLQSFLDMAAKMLANAALQWVLTTLISTGFGGGNTMSAPQVSVAHGGEIPAKRMATGGDAAPNRDSVHILAQPGEVMMRKSAVDFIGKDNLLAMNAMGNRRVSQMPTMAGTQRAPDTTNVYVVAPEAQKQLGKRDIIAAITEDMLQGGKTKQLIKSIQMGAA